MSEIYGRIGVLLTGFVCLMSLKANASVWQPVKSISAGDVHVVWHDPQDPQQMCAGTKSGLYCRAGGYDDFENVFHLPGSVQRIHAIGLDPANDFLYIATDNGLYSADRSWMIFNRENPAGTNPDKSIFDVTVHHKNLYAATSDGVFTRGVQEQAWRKIPLPTKDPGAFHLHSDQIFLYIANLQDVYRLNPDTGRLKRIFHVYSSASNIDKGEQDDPPYEPKSAVADIQSISFLDEHILVLAARKGVFASFDHGEHWVRLNSVGLPVNDINRITFLSDPFKREENDPSLVGNETDRILNLLSRMVVASDQGVYLFQEHRWQPLVHGMMTNAVYDVVSLPPSTLLAGTDHGLYKMEIDGRIKSDNKHPKVMPPPAFTYEDFQSAQMLFREEPTIQEVQQWAIIYAEVNADKIKLWRRQARVRALVPSVSTGIDRSATDLFHWNTGANPDELQKGKEYLDWDVSLNWDFGDMVWSGDQTSIDSRSKLLVELREDILDQVTRLYFERRRLQLELVLLRDLDARALMDKEMRVEELTALLDGYTGGRFCHGLENWGREMGIKG
ncbi:MAG: hypothetical protein KC713_02325 [Candidatus Omnitrophica bacterium]|nr:hypothetical protein [Candidatus Omnitrophota bacterium]